MSTPLSPWVTHTVERTAALAAGSRGVPGVHLMTSHRQDNPGTTASTCLKSLNNKLPSLFFSLLGMTFRNLQKRWSRTQDLKSGRPKNGDYYCCHCDYFCCFSFSGFPTFFNPSLTQVTTDYHQCLLLGLQQLLNEQDGTPGKHEPAVPPRSQSCDTNNLWPTLTGLLGLCAYDLV